MLPCLVDMLSCTYAHIAYVYVCIHVGLRMLVHVHVCAVQAFMHRCLGGLITPAYSLMLRLSTPVYQGRDVICLV